MKQINNMLLIRRLSHQTKSVRLRYGIRFSDGDGVYLLLKRTEDAPSYA